MTKDMVTLTDRPVVERGFVLLPVFYHPVGVGLSAVHRAGAPVEAVLAALVEANPDALRTYVEGLKYDARMEGFDEGYDCGRSAGFEEGAEWARSPE